MLEIEAPEKFRSVRDLRAKIVNHDPRRSDFQFDQVTIDLRKCSTVRAPAAMWCLIYLLLARRANVTCTLRMPQHDETISDFTSMGLLTPLHNAGVLIDGEEKDLGATEIVLPVTGFTTVFQAENAANLVSERLIATGRSSANLHTLIGETFAELANNAAEHSESPIMGFGLVTYQISGSQRQFVCAVADGGVGIRATLSRNPDHAHKALRDWAAIHRATKEGVTGTDDPNRGIGLSGIEDDMTVIGRETIIHSGSGILHMQANLERRSTSAVLFPGTLGVVTIPS